MYSRSTRATVHQIVKLKKCKLYKDYIETYSLDHRMKPFTLPSKEVTIYTMIRLLTTKHNTHKAYPIAIAMNNSIIIYLECSIMIANV